MEIQLPNLQRSRARGCILGGAIGDALGAPVEFLTWTKIKQRFGPAGIVDYAPAYGRSRGAITDDTQMTLFTAEGLLRAVVRDRQRGFCAVPSVVCHAYLRWLRTQDEDYSDTVATAATTTSDNRQQQQQQQQLQIGKDGWLWGVRELHSRRAPGNTCLSSLAAMDRFTEQRAANNSKGAGAIMRVAPVALVIGNGREEDAIHVFNLAKSVSWITHGHPSGYLSAAAFAVILYELFWGRSLESGIHRAQTLLAREEESAETLDAMNRAIEFAASTAAAAPEGQLPADRAIPQLGGAWVGEEALAVALYCALTARGDFAGAVRTAVNHDGDSDTTGLLVGQLMGVALGEESLPEHWLRDLELRDTITQIADDLVGFRSWNLIPYRDSDGSTRKILDRYPGW